MNYIPTTEREKQQMLEVIGIEKIEDLLTDIPSSFLLKEELSLPPAMDEPSLLKHMQRLSEENSDLTHYSFFLGAGMYDHFIPSAVMELTQRAEFKTSYTPYQAEVSQGMLQATYEYQSMLCELTAMDISNASLYDGGTSLVEAALMACKRTKREHLLVSGCVHPEHRHILSTYGKAMGLKLSELSWQEGSTSLEEVKAKLDDSVACLIIQNPNFFGVIEDKIEEMAALAHEKGAKVIVSVDPISLGLLKPPGLYGADIVVGDGQSLGNSMGFGGPSFGFIAIKDEGLSRKERLLKFFPGRIAGLTIDSHGQEAYALCLTSREQHVKREKATSNICTNEALCALSAAIYMALLGKEGLRQVAYLCLQKAHYAQEILFSLDGFSPLFEGKPIFKEFGLKVPKSPRTINEHLLKHRIIGGYDLSRDYPELKNAMLFCTTEKRSKEEIDSLCEALGELAK